MSFEFSSFLPLQLSQAAAHTAQGFTNGVAAGFGLSLPEWRVLAQLWPDTPQSVRDIQTALGMEKSRVSRIASRLHRFELIERASDPDDRRLTRLCLNTKGAQYLHDIEPIAMAYQTKLLRSLGRGGAILPSALELLAKT